MKIGYARVSTIDQNEQSQCDALTAAGCEKIIIEKISSTATRPKLDKILTNLGAGDVLVIVRLDRLGRSLSHLIEIIRQIESQGAGLQSLSENIDTTTAGGRLVFHMMGALAEFERALIVERTQAGLQAARSRGAKLGRPQSVTKKQIQHARKLIESGERPSAVAQSLGISKATLYRHLKPYSQS